MKTKSKIITSGWWDPEWVLVSFKIYFSNFFPMAIYSFYSQKKATKNNGILINIHKINILYRILLNVRLLMNV